MVGLPVRPRRVMLSAILWTLLAIVAGISAVMDQGILSIIITVVASGVALWFWRTYYRAKQRPAERTLPTTKRRR